MHTCYLLGSSYIKSLPRHNLINTILTFTKALAQDGPGCSKVNDVSVIPELMECMSVHDLGQLGPDYGSGLILDPGGSLGEKDILKLAKKGVN